MKYCPAGQLIHKQSCVSQVAVLAELALYCTKPVLGEREHPKGTLELDNEFESYSKLEYRAARSQLDALVIGLTHKSTVKALNVLSAAHKLKTELEADATPATML